MARVIKIDKPKIYANDTTGSDTFSITYTQRVYFKLEKPIEAGATYSDKEKLVKEKMIPINTPEYFETEKILVDGKLLSILITPREEELR